MWGHMDGAGWGITGMGMVLSMLLFWGLVVAAVAVVVRILAGSRNAGTHQKEKSPLDILKERYARGEIERDKFMQQKQDLEQ